MKILYLHQYFKTNSAAGGTRSYEFAKYLSENGINVHVITGTDLDKQYNKEEELFVYTTNTKYNNKMSKWRRVLAFLDYNIKALFKGLKTKNLDIIFATSTPLTIGLPAVLISRFKRKKLIFEVRDVWPDVPIELGYIKNKLLINFLKSFEIWIYNNSKQIIVLSKGMYENLISKGIRADKITIIENMSNLYLYDEISITEKYDFLKNKFVCIHPGTMGHVNGLDFLLDVAKRLISVDKDIVFLLIGEGNRKDYLKRRVAEENLTNVIIKDSLPKQEIVKVIKSSDIGIMCVDNNYKILEDNSANKFFDFLTAGLPVLINYAGWQKEVIESRNCGKSDVDPDSMVNTIIELKNNLELRKEMAKNSRNLAENNYSDIIAKRKILKIMKDI
ncbi:glycosyltransferase family 4 protein [Paenibacillus eucommiae]|uniref:Glycosyltransferase involved in cell wall biosynthesis n=1 Tax=Paenibacillus eucommiae TaxID=1355755 RepID=A0ABS4IRU2_9BACL|nr:glycosyltransferase family 4 protein [Paenibacillus eucommiae]MBP1990294.1 glycosyltransferase involved in cell wall biosynthesis [Paenibacillus eucommiae]